MNQMTEKHDPNGVAITQALAQGTMILPGNDGKLLELPPVPEDIDARDWMHYHCIKEVTETMLAFKRMSASAACRETGWSWTIWKRARKNPAAMGLWRDEIGIAREAGLAHMRARYFDIATAQAELASGTGPHSTRAAQWVSEELNRHEQYLDAEVAQLRAGGQLSEAARLLAEADNLRVEASQTVKVTGEVRR